MPPFFRTTNKIKSVPLCFTQLVYRKANSCFCVALFLWTQYIGQRRVFKIQVLSRQTASENGRPYDPVCTDYLQHCKVITLPNKLCKEKSVISAAESSLSPPMETTTQLSLFTARVAGICAYVRLVYEAVYWLYRRTEVCMCVFMWESSVELCVSVTVTGFGDHRIKYALLMTDLTPGFDTIRYLVLESFDF